MPRKESEATLEANGPVPQQEDFGSGQPTLADVYRLFKESFDRQLKMMKSNFDEMVEETRETSQRVSSLEQDAWQPRFAMVADGQADTTTRERTEGAATAV